MKKIKFKSVLLSLLFVIITAPTISAQTGFGDDVDDEGQTTPETPIDSLLLMGIAGALTIGYVTLSKPEKLNN